MTVMYYKSFCSSRLNYVNSIRQILGKKLKGIKRGLEGNFNDNYKKIDEGWT